MKILIQQLARLGDIYMTWPFVRALKRQHPHAEIHMLVRSKFEIATQGLEQLDRAVVLPSKDILEPILNEKFDLAASTAHIEIFLESLEAEGYTHVYNLSYSPLSSYINAYLADTGVEAIGYTRHADGYFNPNDEVSSYFYGQVGPHFSNRVHLMDIFASYLQVPYEEADYEAPKFETRKKMPRPYVVVHVGASEGHKKLETDLWAKAAHYLLDNKKSLHLVLIGAPHERGIADSICLQLPADQQVRVQNLVGDTQLTELFPIIKDAELLIGCDSAPIHMATLTDTPTLNISVGNVNFWQTGPKASLSFILRMTDELMLVPQKIGIVADELLDGRISEELMVRARGLVSYEPAGEAAARSNLSPATNFAWELTQAIYLGGAYPILDDMKCYKSMLEMAEVNQLILENIQAMSPDSPGDRARLIERGEQILQHISQISPELSPLVRWVAAEKVRIPPGTFNDIKARTFEIHSALTTTLEKYLPQEEARGLHG